MKFWRSVHAFTQNCAVLHSKTNTPHKRIPVQTQKVPLIMTSEIKKILKEMKNNKAPCKDNLTSGTILRGEHSFTFHQGFVHPLQDVVLHRWLPLSSVCCFPFQVVPYFLVMSSCHLVHGRPLDLFPLLGCHSVQRMVHLLSFILAMCPAHLHFCVSVY